MLATWFMVTPETFIESSDADRIACNCSTR
jgi:hypothetical protein